MTNNNLKGILTLVLSVLGYIYYVLPSMYTSFNPITFWQKLIMFFTIDLISLVATLIVVAAVVEGLNKIYDMIF